MTMKYQMQSILFTGLLNLIFNNNIFCFEMIIILLFQIFIN